MYQTVLFDLDGTLIDSRLDLVNAVNHALTYAGVPQQTHDEIVPHIGNGLRILLSEVMGPVPNDQLDRAVAGFSEFYDDHCVDHTVLYESVMDVMTMLNGSHRMGIVTNKPELFAHKILQKLGVANFLGVVVGGDSIPEKKPHPAPVFRAMKQLNAKSGSVLFVGDGIQDMQAGQAAGVKTCIARYGYGFRIESLDLKPDYQLKSFKELKEIVL